MESVKYLGVQFVAAKKLACSVEHVRVKCYRTFNAILSRSKGAQSELDIYMHIYATEVMPLSERLVRSLDFCARQVVSKIFNVQDNNCIDEIRRCCDVPGVHVMIERRRMKFVEKLLADEQLSFLSKVRWC